MRVFTDTRIRHLCFTLIELLIVAAIIAVLICLLLPAASTARSLGRQSACAGNLHSLGQAMQSYCSSFDDWIPGSPNTSGNGADPGGVGKSLYPGYYPCPPVDQQTWPAVHIFDWASPLMAMMGTGVSASIPDRYDLSKRWAFLCPSNQWEATLNHVSRISITTRVTSYATCRILTYVPSSKQTGYTAGTLFWADGFVPEDFMPRLDRIGDSSVKVFLADSCKVDRANPHQISNEDYGYTERGCWLNAKDPNTSTTSLSYRFEPARSQAYRHRNGLNMLFFDGHVEYQPEGSSEGANGFGTGSRQARFWFPSGTNSRSIPSGGSFSNPKIIVP